MDNNRNMFLAIALTIAVVFGFDYFYEQPRREAAEKAHLELVAENEALGLDASGKPLLKTADGKIIPTGSTAAGDVPVGFEAPVTTVLARNRDSVIAEGGRVTFHTSSLEGSISLTGGRFDDLTLVKHKETIEEDSKNVTLLSPSGAENTYYAELGWLAGRKTPNGSTVWTADKRDVKAGETVTLTWDNGEGLKFTRAITLDDDYLFTIKQTVENNTAGDVVIAPYGLISRKEIPEANSMMILHEGPLWVMDDGREEFSYSDLVEMATEEGLEKEERSEKGHSEKGGWLAFADKYWLVSLIPNQDSSIDTKVFYEKQSERFQTQFSLPKVTLAAGGIVENEVKFYAGALKAKVIEGYHEEYDILLFDRAIDWGWLHFLTKPIFYLLSFFYGLVGNFGFAILLLTLTIKAALFPMANKQYSSMGKMKLLQPKMKELKERFGDDREKMQKATMELYKKEKVNPLASCMPLFIQMPIFFALYKVLYIAIDMRHAPFIGWVKDLSAPDPMLITNLFGLIPWEPTGFLALGILPVFMGITMWMQQKLSPQTVTDPMQQKIFALMPIIFTFILAGFAVGLVIYWTWNNILTIIQQWLILKKVSKEQEEKA